MKPILARLLSTVNISDVFKTKGDLKRWSAKRTIGGVLAMTACEVIIVEGISWEAVALAGISVIPITASMFENASSTSIQD
jgi:hypothetical protein